VRTAKGFSSWEMATHDEIFGNGQTSPERQKATGNTETTMPSLLLPTLRIASSITVYIYYSLVGAPHSETP